MTETDAQFVSPTKAVTGYGNPIRVWKSAGGTRIIDDFLTGKVLTATEDVLCYQNSRGGVSTYRISDGDKFEVMSLSSVT